MVRAWNAGVVYTVFQVATNSGRAVVALDFQSSIPGSPRRISEDVALPFAMGNGTVVLQEYAANSSSSNIFKLWNLSRNHLTGAPADDPVSPATANANTWGLYFRSIPPPVGHYAWDPFSGASTLRIDGGPYVTVWEDEWVYFRSGAGVYRFSPSR